MPQPLDWTSHQQAVRTKYEKSLDPFRHNYDELFRQLVWTETARSWEDVLSWIGEVPESWCFRGQRESRWTLQTSLDRSVRVHFRDSHYFLDRREEENKLLFRFKQIAHQFLSHIPPSDDKASWFALMQHHSVPTRLLDWTSSPYVALYFAVEDKPQENSDEREKLDEEGDDGYAAVWAIDLEWLEAKKRQHLESIPTEQRSAYLNGLLEVQSEPLIAKIDPLQGNERMSAQQGFFLWKLYDGTPFFDQILISMMQEPLQVRPVIRKLKVNGQLRIGFLERLRSMNIHSGSLFPGLDGFGKFLRQNLEISVAKQSRQ